VAQPHKQQGAGNGPPAQPKQATGQPGQVEQGAPGYTGLEPAGQFLGHCIEVHRAGGVVGAVSQVQHPAVGQLQAQVVLGQRLRPARAQPVLIGHNTGQGDGSGRYLLGYTPASGRECQTLASEGK
jgi:hypothetical protein